MNFLKTLFWVILIVGLALFAINNWSDVTVRLWGGLLLDTKLPILVIGSFFLGFLPLYLWHRGVGWRLRRRINTLESATPPAPVDPTPEHVFTPPLDPVL